MNKKLLLLSLLAISTIVPGEQGKESAQSAAQQTPSSIFSSKTFMYTTGTLFGVGTAWWGINNADKLAQKFVSAVAGASIFGLFGLAQKLFSTQQKNSELARKNFGLVEDLSLRNNFLNTKETATELCLKKQECDFFNTTVGDLAILNMRFGCCGEKGTPRYDNILFHNQKMLNSTMISATTWADDPNLSNVDRVINIMNELVSNYVTDDNSRMEIKTHLSGIVHAARVERKEAGATLKPYFFPVKEENAELRKRSNSIC